MSDLVERMRAKLQRGKDTRQLAVPVDLEDLEALVRTREQEDEARELLEYLDDCGSSDDVHFTHTQEHDGVREETLPGGALRIWVNSPIGDPDEPGFLEGETISEALRGSRDLNARKVTT